MQREIQRERENFTHNVAWLRRHYGKSKREMAHLLGIGLESLKKLERGEIPPKMSLRVLYSIHANFGVSPAVLLKYRLDE